MKKIAVTVAVLALGLAACEAQNNEDAVENETNIENAAEADVNAGVTDAGNAADNALDAAGNLVEDTGNAVENGANAVANTADNATE